MNLKSLLPMLGLLLWLIALPLDVLAHETPAPTAEPQSPAADSTVEVADSLIPAEGEWWLTLDATAVASCISLKRFMLPSSRIFDPTTFSASLSVTDDDSFQFRDDEFTRVSGTNRFTGGFSFPDATTAHAIVRLVTTTAMRGQLVADYRVDTTRCSETVQFVFRRR